MSDRPPSQATVTQLLEAAHGGDRGALDALFPLVYEELRALAHHARRHWQGDLTLNATAIVHEAYIKLVDQSGHVPASRGHFFAIAAKAMRQILCNYARDRNRIKRGGGAEHIPLEYALNSMLIEEVDLHATELSALDDALQRLEQLNERQSKVIECRFFGGLSIEETALALGLSPATVKRDWTMARAWLYREIHQR